MPVFAAAQTSPTRGNYKANLNDHYHFIDLAVKNGAEFIVFPEMSITGYEREKAKELSFTLNDSRLDKLKDLSVQNNLIIIAGAPVLKDGHLYIGSFIFKPDQTISLYTKHFLHPGEEIAFEPSMDYDPIVRACKETISFAICADIDHSEHPQQAAEKKASIYVASIFFSPGGLPDAYSMLSAYASNYNMNILMSNFCGQSWGSDAGGKSAFWDQSGTLVKSLEADKPGLLLIQKNGNWEGESILV